jgi:ABC-2 type transport system ATP-binding protein
MSSHILAEVSRLANRIGIIHEGHLLQEMDVNDLEKNRCRRLLVRVRDPGTALAALAAAGFLVETVEDGSLELRDQAALDHPDEIASLLVQAKTPPTHLSLDLEDLEQYFLRLVGLQGGLK